MNDELQGAERRLVLRLLTYWRDLQDEFCFPCFADLNPVELDDIWSHCFVLDLSGNDGDPIFRTVGEAFAGFAECGFGNLKVSELPDDTLAWLSTYYFAEIIEKRAPVSRGGEFTGRDGVKVLYRSILLPMAEDGETISGFFGAANCREVVVEDIIEPSDNSGETATKEKIDNEVV